MMESIFESLKDHPRSVILDTDIGPDCDDVGALVCLLHYAGIYGFPVVGICNCTSNPSGTGAIDAICRHCGVETPLLGQWSGREFLNDPPCHRYNDAVAQGFSKSFREKKLHPLDHVTFYRKLLAEAADDDVMIVTIGMFNDLADLLDSGADEISPLTGMELVRAKVHCLVSMATILPAGREYNIFCDADAAKRVFSVWPTPVFLSDFEIGFRVRTGYPHVSPEDALATSPAATAYRLYSEDGKNASFDLTAVQFAVLGEGDLYGLLPPVELEFFAEIPDLPDATRPIPTPDGRFHYMQKRVDDEALAASLNQILHQY